jgi:hypothetical protein
MKTFSQLRTELNEAAFKVPSGEKELKRDTVRAGSKKFELVFVQNKKRKVEVYLDGNNFGQEFKDLKDAEKEMKDIRGVLSQMEDFSMDEFKEFFNEVNI